MLRSFCSVYVVFLLLWLVSACSQPLQSSAQQAEVVSSIREHYEDRMIELSLSLQRHYAQRLYRMTGEEVFLPYNEYYAHQLITTLRRDLDYLADDPDYLLYRDHVLLQGRPLRGDVAKLAGKLHPGPTIDPEVLEKFSYSQPVDDVAEQTLSFLVRWLVSHILESDRFLASVVKAKQQGLTTDEALSIAQSSMQDATGVLMSVIRSMYVSHSLNTLRLEQSLRDSEERYRVIFEQSHDAMMIVAPPDWGLRAGNPAMVELFGARDFSELKTLSPIDLSPEQQADGCDSTGNWVIETALIQLDKWSDVEWTVSVNVGAHQLQHPSFLGGLQSALSRYPSVPPHRLEIEMLESSALFDLEHAARIIEDCLALGCELAQGYFIARPMQADAIPTWIAEWQLPEGWCGHA